MSADRPEWTTAPVPPDDPDAVFLYRAYLDEVISRYHGRPALASEIDEEAASAGPVAPPGLLLVARHGPAPVGCAGVRLLTPAVGELTRVFLLPAARGRGGGARLVGAAEEMARARGVTEMRLNTRLDLVEARALYARLGYRDTAPYGDDPHAEVWLAKRLR